MSDPNVYRTYPGNIACDKLKGIKEFRCPKCEVGALNADSVSTSSITFKPSGVLTYAGSSVFGTTHTITPTLLPLLGNVSCSGNITLYIKNDLYVAVVMAVIVKSKSTILQTLIYQNVGNFTSVAMTYSGSNVIVTTSPGSTLKWVFNGI